MPRWANGCVERVDSRAERSAFEISPPVSHPPPPPCLQTELSLPNGTLSLAEGPTLSVAARRLSWAHSVRTSVSGAIDLASVRSGRLIVRPGAGGASLPLAIGISTPLNLLEADKFELGMTDTSTQAMLGDRRAFVAGARRRQRFFARPAHGHRDCAPASLARRHSTRINSTSRSRSRTIPRALLHQPPRARASEQLPVRRGWGHVRVPSPPGLIQTPMKFERVLKACLIEAATRLLGLISFRLASSAPRPF